MNDAAVIPPRASAGFHAAAAALYAALALAVTFPIWLAPAARLETLGDPQLNAYILAWDCRAAFHHIGEFFQANMFWPHADALAYGEHLITLAALVSPAALLGADAPLLHNLSVIEAFFLSALAAHALAWRMLRSRAGSLMAGLVYGFAACRLNQTTHVQLIHGEFLPLMILGFEMLLESLTAENRTDQMRGRGGAWLLGFAALGQWLVSWYWCVFTLWAAGPYMLARLWQSRRALAARCGWKRALAAVAAPLLVAALLVAPVAWPYAVMKYHHELVRPQFAGDDLFATPLDWLAPPPRALLYGGFQQAAQRADFNGERALFPGLLVVCAAAAALIFSIRRRARGAFPVRLWLALTALLVSFTFGRALTLGGLAIPMPLALAEIFSPASDQMRAAARWVLPAALGFAMLAAWSLAELRARLASSGARAAAVCALALACAESLARPMHYAETPDAAPEVFRWLEARPFVAPVFILPVDHPRLMLDAAWHSQPMVNGSNGYFPPLHRVSMGRLAAFPAPEKLKDLQETGVRYVIVDVSVPQPTPPSGKIALPTGAGSLAQWRARLAKAEAAGRPKFATQWFPPYLVIELPAAANPYTNPAPGMTMPKTAPY